MTQKQIDTLKELGFIRGQVRIIHKDQFLKKINTKIMGLVIVAINGTWISVYCHSKNQPLCVSEVPFTLTKLREIVGKLEKL